jgi:hypothetical protein
MPFQRIIGDIFPQAIKPGLVSHNVIVKAALPQFRVGKKTGGARRVRRLAFERTNRGGQRDVASSQLQQRVEVVWHDHELIENNGAVSSRQLQQLSETTFPRAFKTMRSSRTSPKAHRRFETQIVTK